MLGLFQTDLQFLYWAITMIPKHGAGDVSKERHNSILLFLSESLCKIIKAPQLYHDIKVKHLGEKVRRSKFEFWRNSMFLGPCQSMKEPQDR